MWFMKRFCLLICLISLSFCASAQNDNEPSAAVQRDDTYLFDAFEQATLLLVSGKSLKARFNYNKVTEEMVFWQFNRLMAVDMPAVDSIFIAQRKFVPVGQAFYEVIAAPGCIIYVRHLARVTSKGKPAGYGAYSETAAINRLSGIAMPDHYYPLEIRSSHSLDDRSTMWVLVDGRLYKANTACQLFRAFPEHKRSIRAFSANRKIRRYALADLLQLVQHFHFP